MRMGTFLAAGLTVLCLGCSQQPAAKPAGSAPATNAPAAQSTAREVIEGFTGKTAVDAGQRAKAKLKAVDAQRQQDMNEVLKQ